jgi:hypothetical protein
MNPTRKYSLKAFPFAGLVVRACVSFFIIVAGPAQAAIGWVQVLDQNACTPIENAVVTVDGKALRTDVEGMAPLPEMSTRVLVRAPGHGRVVITDDTNVMLSVVLHLPSVTPRALYLSFYGIGDGRLRRNALKLLDETELNALVIDVKGDRGYIPYRSKVALAAIAGAQKIITVRDMPGLIATLRAQGIYLIARIVVFKDDPLARTHPEWAVRIPSGAIWHDREGLAWSDPFRQEVWDYNLDIAEEAAQLGFDEIQFDYLRFPDEPGLVFSKPSTEKSRVAAISGFLTAARKRLAPYNVFVAADFFGYTLWNKDDTGVGQRLEDQAPILDYTSPMLYPSGFQFGIPGYSNPVAHPYEIVGLSLRNAQKRTGLPAQYFRPWLQAFHDYAFDHRRFGADQIAEQIKAAEDFGSDGWMLWNPQNVYTDAGLKKEQAQ